MINVTAHLMQVLALFLFWRHLGNFAVLIKVPAGPADTPSTNCGGGFNPPFLFDDWIAQPVLPFEWKPSE